MKPDSTTSHLLAQANAAHAELQRHASDPRHVQGREVSREHADAANAQHAAITKLITEITRPGGTLEGMESK